MLRIFFVFLSTLATDGLDSGPGHCHSQTVVYTRAIKPGMHSVNQMD
jgi:hypothetical protein